MKKEGRAETTISGVNKRLKSLDKHTDLDNPEAVKEYIANKKASNAYKETLVNAYNHYVRAFGLSWEKPVYKRAQRLPAVPSTEQVNIANKQIIKTEPKICEYPNCDRPAAFHDIGAAGPVFLCKPHHDYNVKQGLIKASRPWKG